MSEGDARKPRAPRPFTVNPEVMAAIRPMQFRDAQRVAELHHAAMGNSLWAQLGIPFLSTLYQQLINRPELLAFVYEEDGRIGGFIAGSTDPELMLQKTFRKSWFLLGPAAARGLRDLSVLKKLAETARYFRASGNDVMDQPVKAESLFCSFERGLRGKRISGHINKVLFDDLLARGHSHVKVTTEVDNKGANRQLTSWGFVDAHRFRFYGKDMVTYVLDLEASDRVEAVSRHPSN